MEQARYWIWTNRKHVFASQNATNPSSSYGDSWEEQAFAEDAAGTALGGCVWPPRSYSCSFCRREFKSAQALGGHMNVHRRDRARLKQSPSQHDVVILPPQISPVRVSSSLPPEKMDLGLSPPFFSTVLSENYSARARSNLVADNCFHVRDLIASKSNDGRANSTDLSAGSTLNLLLSRTHSTDEDEIPRCCKRRRIDYETGLDDFLYFHRKSSSPELQERCKRLHPDVTRAMSPNPIGDELDLELRLGDPPKV